MDIADLHVSCGVLQNGADVICNSDGKLLGYDPMGSIRVQRPKQLAGELGLIDAACAAARVT